MRKLLLTLLVLVALPFAAADVSDMCQTALDMGIHEGVALPKLLPYHNERIAVYDMNDNVIGSIITKKGLIESANCETIDDPTYKVFVSGEQTIQDLYDSDDRFDLFNKMLSDKRIIIDGQSFGRDVKASISKTFIKIAGWFR